MIASSEIPISRGPLDANGCLTSQLTGELPCHRHWCPLGAHPGNKIGFEERPRRRRSETSAVSQFEVGGSSSFRRGLDFARR